MKPRDLAAGFSGFVNSRLSRRFLALLVAILTVVSLCFLVLVMVIYRNQLIGDHARASLEVNHLLEATLENAMLKRDIPGLRDVVDRLGKQEGIAGVMILDPHGEVRFASTAQALGVRLRDEQVLRSLADQTPRTAFMRGSQGGEWLRSVNPVRNQPACRECHGTIRDNPVNGVLVVDYDAAGIRASAMRTAGLLGMSGVIVISCKRSWHMVCHGSAGSFTHIAPARCKRADRRRRIGHPGARSGRRRDRTLFPGLQSHGGQG